MTDASPSAQDHGQAPASSGQPQAGNASSSTPTPSAAPQAGADNASTPAQAQAPMTLEDAQAALREARKEAAQYRVKAKELDDLKRAQEEATLTETQKLQRQLAEEKAAREQQAKASSERVIRVETRAAALQLGIEPKLAVRLIDFGAVTLDEAGDPTNIAELLQAAIQEYGLTPATPAAPPPGAPGSPAAPSTPVRPAGGGATAPARSSLTPPPAPVNPRDIPSLTSKDLWTRGR